MAKTPEVTFVLEFDNATRTADVVRALEAVDK